MNARILLASACVLAAVGCGSNGPPGSEDFGNLLASPGTCTVTTSRVCTGNGDCPPGETCNGLILIQEEHPTGWGRPDCFACHEVRDMHTINRTGLPDAQVNLAGIRAIIATEGEGSCALCHGTNGVQP